MFWGIKKDVLLHVKTPLTPGALNVLSSLPFGT